MTLLDDVIHCCNNITPFQVAIVLSVLVLYALHLFLRDLDVPPGPRGLLLFGYWPFLKTNTCHLQLQELARKYGDVFSLRGTGRLFIHLGSVKAVREAHLTKAECFEGRYTDFSLLSFFFQDGLIFINGEPWKVLRRFFITKFKEYGMNAVKENASCSVYDALKGTVEELRNTKSRPFKIADLASSKCMAVIKRIIFNEDGVTQEELQEINDHYCIVVNALTSKNFLLMGNFAKYFIFPFMSSYWSAKRSNKRIEDILFKVVERHKADYDEKRVSDLIDSYLKERDDRRQRGDPTAAHFTDKALVSSLAQFVTDGVLTVGLLVGVCLTTLAEHPDEQEKLYEEILDVIGPDRLPTMEDKTHLPYTNAFIQEVLRYSDFFPLYPSLECTKETTVFGYKIPKRSITLINLYAIHRNPETYENPDEFVPSRFLSTPDKPKPDLPLLFGMGRRFCIGETFSMIQVFLLMTTIVQNFRIAYPEGSQGSENMFWTKERVQICAYPRSHKSDGKVY